MSTKPLFQLLALSRKNAVLYLRNWKTTLVMLLVPFFCIMLLKLFLVGMAVNLRDLVPKMEDIKHPKVFEVGALPKCKQIGGRMCKTIIYSPNNDSYVDSIVQNVLKNSNLPSDDFMSFYNETVMEDYMLASPNTSSIAIAFSTNVSNSVRNVDYNIYYNGTTYQEDQFTAAYPPVIVTEVQLAVDNTLYRMTADEQGMAQNLDRFIDVLTKDFPSALPINATNPWENIDFEGILMSFMGIFFIQISLSLWWTVHLYYMVMEKSKNLRFNLTSMGASWIVYHLSHIITAFVIMILSVFVAVTTGYIMVLPFYTHSNYVCLFIVHFCFGAGTLGIMMLICSIVSNQRVALILAFIINGLTSVASLIAANGIAVYYLYNSVPTAAWILTIFPAFNFAKCVADVSSYTYGTMFIRNPQGYGWHEWVTPVSILRFSEGRIPASYENCLYCLATGIVTTLISLYLDLVLPTSRNGAPLPFYFFLLPEYWKPKSSIDRFRDTAEDAKRLTNDPEIAKQVDLALDTERALRIIQLQKKYGSVEAVKNISLTAQQGTCLAILGHNGAGKTTTVNALLGQINPTNGTALVYGMDIRNNQNGIRKVMGACPQHDVLYDTMTAREHCWVYGLIKGLRGKELQAEIEERLKDVGLWSVRDKASSTFSGGMKRRLSVAISFIGNPQIVLLDEPTTGLDPKSKRLIWNLVHLMKKEKLIVLTTHSMEEAEKLSDSIVIMAFGQIKCIGNALSLKSQFGAGYNLTVISQSPPQIKSLISRFVSAGLVSENGDSLMFNIPNVGMGELIPLVREIEKSPIVRDWALSQTTLEEVYLRVTDLSHFGYSPNLRSH